MSRLPSGNIVGYLPKSDRKKWRRKLRRAYQNPTYEEAKAALKGLHKELQQMNRSAARSLEEGLEQTLTLHRLGVFEEVGRSLKTTNAIENLNSLVEDYIRKVIPCTSPAKRPRKLFLPSGSTEAFCARRRRRS